MRREGDPRFLQARLVLFFVAAAIFIGGMISGWRELALVALGILGLALALRFLPAPDGRGEPNREEEARSGAPDAD